MSPSFSIAAKRTANAGCCAVLLGGWGGGKEVFYSSFQVKIGPFKGFVAQ